MADAARFDHRWEEGAPAPAAVPGYSMSTDQRDLGWLLENLAERARGVRHVLVLSRDGLRICHTPELQADQADQLAAIASGIQSLSLSASGEFGSGPVNGGLGTGGSGDAGLAGGAGGLGGERPWAGQSMVEFRGGVLLIVPAGEGAHLAVIAHEDADVGLVGHYMNELVEQIGGHLTAAPRTPGPDVRA